MASRRRLSCALAATVALLAAPVTQAAEPRALVAYLPSSPAQDLGLLDRFAGAGMAVGLVSPVTGGWEPAQTALDISQGARIPTRLYDEDLPSVVRVSRRDEHARLLDWGRIRRRAAGAPGELEPGLLAETLRRSGRDVVHAGKSVGSSRLIDTALLPAAADRAGRVRPAGDASLLGGAWRPGAVVFADLPAGDAGVALARRLAAAPNALVIVMQRPGGDRLRLMPAGMSAPGGLLRSATTRRDGLVAATDIAPTVLRHMGVAVPDEMQGRAIGRVGGDTAGLRELAERLDVVSGRRGPALLAFAALVLAASLAAGRRIALLAVLWLPAVALLAAALRPSEPAEAALLAAGPVALAAATDRLVPWPRGPWLPAVVSLAAHAVDLVRGSDLIGQAVTGPNPAGGARFYGVGNELETLLALTALLGAGAWLTSRKGPGPYPTVKGPGPYQDVKGPGPYQDVKGPGPYPAVERAPVVFGVAGGLVALVLGAGRLGADVGAVITLGAGTAAAAAASLPGGPSRRAVAIAVATPVAAVGLLALVDLATGGDSHFATSVLGADEGGDLGEVVRRRLEGSLSGIGRPGAIAATAVALGVLVLLAARRGRIAAPRPLAAALTGCWFAVVAGALGNDSGPLILWIGAATLGLAALYAKSPDDARES